MKLILSLLIFNVALPAFADGYFDGLSDPDQKLVTQLADTTTKVMNAPREKAVTQWSRLVSNVRSDEQFPSDYYQERNAYYWRQFYDVRVPNTVDADWMRVAVRQLAEAELGGGGPSFDSQDKDWKGFLKRERELLEQRAKAVEEFAKSGTSSPVVKSFLRNVRIAIKMANVNEAYRTLGHVKQLLGAMQALEHKLPAGQTLNVASAEAGLANKVARMETKIHSDVAEIQSILDDRTKSSPSDEGSLRYEPNFKDVKWDIVYETGNTRGGAQSEPLLQTKVVGEVPWSRPAAVQPIEMDIPKEVLRNVRVDR
jgi:hypothetical protein